MRAPRVALNVLRVDHHAVLFERGRHGDKPTLHVKAHGRGIPPPRVAPPTAAGRFDVEGTRWKIDDVALRQVSLSL
jgi:hypothetical protein